MDTDTSSIDEDHTVIFFTIFGFDIRMDGPY